MKSFKRNVAAPALLILLEWMLGGCVIDVVGPDGDHGHHEQRVEVSAAFLEVLDVGTQGALAVVGNNGSVLVLGDPQASQVTVSAVRRVRSDTRQDAQAHLPLLEVVITVDAGGFVVKTRQPQEAHGRGYEVDYTITVPETFEVSVTNGNGEVEVAELVSDVGVQVGNGNVTLDDVNGSCWVSLGNGEIESLVRLPEGGQIVQAVGNGSVRLTVQPQVSASFAARVGNGSISIGGLAFTSSTTKPNIVEGVLGGGAGLVDLSVGNGWIRVHGG